MVATAEERMRILTMIQEKQITAEEGARLLAALNARPGGESGQQPANKARWLRVRVTDAGTGKLKVNVNIPVGLVDIGIKMGARFAPEMQNMDMTAVQTAIHEGYQGKILEVEDQQDNERVELFVE